MVSFYISIFIVAKNVLVSKLHLKFCPLYFRISIYPLLNLFSSCLFVVVSVMVQLLLIQLLMESLILSVMYVWCQLNADVIVTFWFGMRFKVCVAQCSYVCCNLVLRCVTCSTFYKCFEVHVVMFVV